MMIKYIILYLLSLSLFGYLVSRYNEATGADAYSWAVLMAAFAIGSLVGTTLMAASEEKDYICDPTFLDTVFDLAYLFCKIFLFGISSFVIIFILVGFFLIVARGFSLPFNSGRNND